MPKKKLKTHLFRANSTTYCGKVIDGNTGSPLNSDGTVSPDRVFTNELDRVTCKTCLKAHKDQS
jgi:hypothetical protein